MAAAAQDASTIFFNPAGMALQSGNELQLGVHYIIPKAAFKNQGSTTVLDTPLTGNNGGDGGESALVPNLFYMHSFSEKWRAGYQFTQLIRADFAYGHLFVDDPKINKVTTGEDRARGALVGEYDASVDIISASVSFQF